MPDQAPASRVNDFAFKMGTVNGTGSASANSLLMQAIFRMGIPVTGKNVFPSNIQGLPTWYEIPGEQGRLHRAAGARRSRRGTQPGDVRQGRRRGAPRRLPALRFVLAARRQAHSRRNHDSRHSLRQDVRRVVRGRSRSYAPPQHRLRRRTGRVARDRHGHRRRDAAREVLEEARAARRELPRDPARLRLREGDTTTVPCPSISSGWTRRRTAFSSTATRPRRLAQCTPARPSARGIRSRRRRR